MSEQLHDRVTDLLERADDQSGSFVAGTRAGDGDEAGDESTANDLRELADEANEILESSDPDELLAAVGLETLPNGTEPDSIPEAIARGDPDAVEDLQRLLHLARLADRSDDLEDAIGSVRAGIGDAGAGESAEAAKSKVDSGGESDASPAEDSRTAPDTAPSDAEDTTSDLEDRLRSAMSSSLTDFSDDVSQLQERLKSIGNEDGADESDSTVESDHPAADEDARKAEPDGEANGESDDGLFGTDLGSGGDRGASARGTRYSTMAPPPSKRADMRGTARFSTIPGKLRN